jgi:hypothetical protein
MDNRSTDAFSIQQEQFPFCSHALFIGKSFLSIILVA